MEMRSLKTFWYYKCASPSFFLPHGKGGYPWVFIGWTWKSASSYASGMILSDGSRMAFGCDFALTDRTEEVEETA